MRFPDPCPAGRIAPKGTWPVCRFPEFQENLSHADGMYDEYERRFASAELRLGRRTTDACLLGRANPITLCRGCRHAVSGMLKAWAAFGNHQSAFVSRS